MNEDKQKMDKWWQHEGLDRTHMLLVMLQEGLGYEDNLHPSIWNKKCEKLLSKATSALAGLYQAIGEWQEDDESK